MDIPLKAKTAREARREIASRFPQGASYKGYDANGVCVLISTVRARGDKAHVATALIPDRKSVTFTCEPTNIVLCKCLHTEDAHNGGPWLRRWCLRCDCMMYEANT